MNGRGYLRESIQPPSAALSLNSRPSHATVYSTPPLRGPKHTPRLHTCMGSTADVLLETYPFPFHSTATPSFKKVRPKNLAVILASFLSLIAHIQNIQTCCMALLTKCILNTITSHHLFCYNLILSHHIFAANELGSLLVPWPFNSLLSRQHLE